MLVHARQLPEVVRWFCWTSIATPLDVQPPGGVDFPREAVVGAKDADGGWGSLGT